MDTTKFMGFVLVLALLPSGCATDGSRPKKPPRPPSEEIRAQVGTLGVTTTGILTNLFLQRKRGLGMGASIGLGALEGGGLALDTVGDAAEVAPALLVIAVPIGLFAGAAAGAVKGQVEVKAAQLAEAQQEQLRKIEPLTDLRDIIGREIYRAAQERTAHRVVFAPDGTPVPPAVDTVLEVNVVHAGLIASRKEDSSELGAYMAVRIRLVRSKDGAQLYARTWLYRSGVRVFDDWMEGNGRALHQELSRLAPQLAETVVEELFLVYEPPRKTSSRRAKAP